MPVKASLTYRSSGVDIDKADTFIKSIKPLAEKTHRREVLRGIGGFGGFFRADTKDFKKPVLVSSADGVGTKVLCALKAKRYRALGIDVVAMNVNDLLTCGAQPLFFLDYLAVGHLENKVLREIVQGMAQGCLDARCALIGGETAEMPGLYGRGEMDLAGFAVGVVEEDSIIDGRSIRRGDILLGCASNGLHANGFSLVRKVFSENFISAHADEILRPTRIYVRLILKLISEIPVRGMAHITGGGIYEKLGRILPKGLAAVVYSRSWKVPRVFEWIEKRSRVSNREMFRTFNMGIGFIIVVSPLFADRALTLLRRFGQESWMIGEIDRGEGVWIR